MPRHPLGEVFGFPIENHSDRAQLHRDNELCPYNNKEARCTKVSRSHPLGVCSQLDGEQSIITCPVRFRQDWRIASDAAAFFFPAGATWKVFPEVRIRTADDLPAGNIDIVLVSHNQAGDLLDFGTLEVQSVYISGNVRTPFEYYMEHRNAPGFVMDWTGQPNYPRPDYLSSSRKRLAPQLLYKGTILKSWGKKQAIAIQRQLFDTLPTLPTVPQADADLAWFVYDLTPDAQANRYDLTLTRTVYTDFSVVLDHIGIPDAGPADEFTQALQARLTTTLNPPTRRTRRRAQP